MIDLADLPLLLSPVFSLGIGWLLFRRQSLFLRPSALWLLGANLLYQWPAVWHTDYVTELPQPLDWYLLAFGLPFAWLGWLWFLHLRHPARIGGQYAAAKRIAQHFDDQPGNHAWLFRAWPCALPIAVLYLMQVPITETGLWAMIFDPLAANEAREESWKLIQDPLTKYTFGWLVYVFAPTLVYAHALSFRDAWRAGRIEVMAGNAVAGTAALCFACLSGHRTTAMLILFGLALLYWLSTGLRFRIYWIGLAGMGLLVLPAIMTVQREGRAMTIENVAMRYGDILKSRLAETPVAVSTAWVDHCERHGYYYGDTIRLVATALGREPINLPNVIGHHYFNPHGTGLDSVSANIGMHFSFYADFGLAGAFALTWLVLAVIDRAALWIIATRPSRVAAVLAVLWAITCVHLLQSAAPVTVLSSGLGLIFVVTWFAKRRWAAQKQLQN